MPALVEKEICCGCSACANACPTGCITMRADYTGFLYPVIDEKKCLGCKKCERACPALNKIEPIRPSEDTMYVVAQHKNPVVLEASTSGGAFTAFAESIILQGGVVFGACFDGEYNVKHIKVDNVSDLARFRSSKYVQSNIGMTYKETLNILDMGRKVLFSGTPCQIAGLHQFLGKEFPNLYTIDVMCRAVPSPLVFKKYLELCRMRFSQIDRMSFRDKTRGYSYSTMAIYGYKGNTKKVYRRGKESDEWLRLFFGGYCNRDSCYQCQYQTGKRISDITMWDCFRVYELAPQFDDNRGATNVIAWTEKGRELIGNASNSLNYQHLYFDMDMSNLYRKNGLRARGDKEEFYRDVKNLETAAFFAKYTPNRLDVRLKDWARKITMKMGIHDSIRKCVHKIRDINNFHVKSGRKYGK